MITNKERQRRIAERRQEVTRLRADPDTPRKMFWLSFADETGNLGGCLVDDVVNIMDAVDKSHRLGINPGGEIMFVEVDPTVVPPGHPVNALLSMADIRAWDKRVVQS